MIMVRNISSSDIAKSRRRTKLYNPLTKKLVVSKDVIFDEESVWSWSDEDKAKEQQVLEEPDCSQQNVHQASHHLLSLPHRPQHIGTLHLLWEMAAADPPQIKVQLR
jgi:hypothetical protein